jgi:hypothetical protein
LSVHKYTQIVEGLFGPMEDTLVTREPLPLAYPLPEEEYVLYAHEINGELQAIPYVTRVVSGIEQDVPAYTVQ